MDQAAPAPVGEHSTLRAPSRGKSILSTLRERWAALGVRPLTEGFLIALWVFLLVVVSLGTSAGALGVKWSISAWQPTSTPASTSFQVTARVQAFYQGDPGVGWDSQAQFNQWWPSACAPAALTMALRAWGTPVGIGPVLDRLIARQAITPDQGLLDANALAQVAQSYGYQARTLWHWTVQQVAQVTRQGVPVLVDVVDAKQQTPYPGLFVGHWLVVVGVSGSGQVTVRDSSGYHIQSLTPALFDILFTGVSVVLWRGTFSLPA